MLIVCWSCEQVYDVPSTSKTGKEFICPECGYPPMTVMYIKKDKDGNEIDREISVHPGWHLKGYNDIRRRK